LATAELKEHLAESSMKLGSYKLKPELKFEETLKQFETQIKEETKLNSSFISAKNPIIEGLKVKPLKYEDQILPSLKNPKLDLDDHISLYE